MPFAFKVALGPRGSYSSSTNYSTPAPVVDLRLSPLVYWVQCRPSNSKGMLLLVFKKTVKFFQQIRVMHFVQSCVLTEFKKSTGTLAKQCSGAMCWGADNLVKTEVL